MKKVLAISPYFPPANTPDMQRLRMALPYFAENGWEVTVAMADPSCYDAPRDELLGATIPPGTRVMRLPCWSEANCRRFGFGHLSNRIVWPWRHAVRRILENERFDLVFFTTTQSMVMANAPYWRRKTGVPYVIDLQDPIFVPGGSYTRKNSPGAYWKYRVSHFFSQFLERLAFARPSAVVATSSHYLDALRKRHARLSGIPMATLPFGLPEADLQMVDGLVRENTIFSRTEGNKIILYAGRGGPDLHPAFRALFQATARLRQTHDDSAAKLRFIFVGTSYGPAGSGQRQVAPLAEECGCGDLVSDEPDRRPYFEVLKATKEADCALVLGSQSADYTASKAMMTLAAAKRVLAIVHRDSLVAKLYNKHSNAMLCLFDDTAEEVGCMEEIVAALRAVAEGARAGQGEVSFDRGLTARAMTKQLCALFECATAGKGSPERGKRWRADAMNAAA